MKIMPFQLDLFHFYICNFDTFLVFIFIKPVFNQESFLCTGRSNQQPRPMGVVADSFFFVSTDITGCISFWKVLI